MAAVNYNFISEENEGPTFEPVFVTDYQIVKQDLDFTNRPLEIAIDDFFNYDTGIVYDNRGNQSPAKEQLFNGYKYPYQKHLSVPKKKA